MEGDLDEVLQGLMTHYQAEALKATVKSPDHDGKPDDNNN
jgi:hypothetical protein